MHFVALSVLVIIKQIHSRSVVHGDIKPDNFATKSKKIVALDFGLSFFYEDPLTKKHNQYHESQSCLIGTLRYASLSNHFGICYSRRDDIESFLYMMLYFNYAHVPWQHLEDHSEIRECKEKLGPSMFENMGPMWKEFYSTVRNLTFEETIDYDMWIELMGRECVEGDHNALYPTAKEALPLPVPVQVPVQVPSSIQKATDKVSTTPKMSNGAAEAETQVLAVKSPFNEPRTIFSTKSNTMRRRKTINSLIIKDSVY